MLFSNRHIPEANNFKVCEIIWATSAFYFRVSTQAHAFKSLPAQTLEEAETRTTTVATAQNITPNGHKHERGCGIIALTLLMVKFFQWSF